MQTMLIGILNITPDSFSDGGQYYNNPTKAVEHAKHMITEGADIIDIGGESARPGADSVSTEEELRRVIPVIQTIKKQLGNSLTLSIDTNKSDVAKAALENGAEIVNSLGGFSFDNKLANVVAQYQCRFLMYHIKGKPKTMQKGTITYNNITGDIATFFQEQIKLGTGHGIKKDRFMLDPGIGFGKTVEQNIEIIKQLHEFKKFELPIVIGVSRKSSLGKILQTELALEQLPPEEERLEASLAATAAAVLNGANMIRTHDISQTKKFLAVLERFTN